MLFGSESISTYSRANVLIWMVLAFQAGLLNIGGLMACHGFVSHVTGYATLFGMQINQSHYSEAAKMLMVPVFFLLGAMLSGYLVDLRLRLRKKPKYYIAFGVLFLLLLFIVIGGFNGFFGKFGEPMENHHAYALVALLCLTCGVQNGLVSLVSKSVVRTTHLTGITTDLGIGLVRVLNSRKIGGTEGEMRANFMRAGVITFFAMGSAVGYGLFHGFEYRGFLFPVVISGCLFLMTFYFQVLKKKRT